MTMKDKITKSLGEVPESKNGIYFHIFKDTDEVVVFVDKTSKFYMDTPSDNLDVCLNYNRIFLKGVDRKSGYFLDAISKDIWCITWVEKEYSHIKAYYDHIESVIYQIIMREKYELKYQIMPFKNTKLYNSNTIETMLKNMDISYGVYKDIPYTININCITSGVSVTFYYLEYKGCINKKKMNNRIIDICRNHDVNYIYSYDGHPNKIIYNNVLEFGFKANDMMKTKDVFLRLKVYESIVKECIDVIDTIKNENTGGNTMENKITSFEITENKDVIIKNAGRETILEIPARIAKILTKNYTKLTEGKFKLPYSVGILNPDLLKDFSEGQHAEVIDRNHTKVEERKTEFLYSPKSSNVNSISERDSSELDSRIYFENIKAKKYTFRYKMYSYLIKSIGSHPCVYIILDKNIQDIIDVENNINVHGGVTYTDEYMFGWDYAHLEDMLYIEPNKTVSWKNKQNKAYTLEELKRDAEDAIDQIIDLRCSIGKFKISEEPTGFASLSKIFINRMSFYKYLESCFINPYDSSIFINNNLKEYYIKKYNITDDKLIMQLKWYINNRLASIVCAPALSYFTKDIILKEANKLSKQIEKEIKDKFNIK